MSSNISNKVDSLILINLLLFFVFPAKMGLQMLYPSASKIWLVGLVFFALVIVHEFTLYPEVKKKVEKVSAQHRLKRRINFSLCQTFALTLLYLVLFFF